MKTYSSHVDRMVSLAGSWVVDTDLVAYSMGYGNPNNGGYGFPFTNSRKFPRVETTSGSLLHQPLLINQ